MKEENGEHGSDARETAQENDGINFDLINEILDFQPLITSYVHRLTDEEYGDEGLIEAANPGYTEAKETCEKLIEESGMDEEHFMAWVTEAERAAYRIGVIVALRLARREDLLRKVAGHI